jgi:hypothetical protein
MATAAIRQQERREAADRIEVRPVHDQPTALLAGNEACTLQDRQMGRKRILRNRKRLRQLTGWHPMWQPRDEQAKGLQAGSLSQGRKRESRNRSIHNSRMIDGYDRPTTRAQHQRNRARHRGFASTHLKIRRGDNLFPNPLALAAPSR